MALSSKQGTGDFCTKMVAQSCACDAYPAFNFDQNTQGDSQKDKN